MDYLITGHPDWREWPQAAWGESDRKRLEKAGFSPGTFAYSGVDAEHQEREKCNHIQGIPLLHRPVEPASRSQIVRDNIGDKVDKLIIFDMDGTLMIGDHPEDEQAVKSGGCAFQWAHIFFGR